MLSQEKQKKLAYVARRYYLENQRQSDIAKELGVSRPLVSRMLYDARELGELYSLSGKAVDVGGTYFGGTVATQVTDAKVVGNQIYNVRFLTGIVSSFFFRRISAPCYQGCARKEGP